VVLVAGGDEVAEDGVGLEGLGLEFGAELAAEEEGVGGDLGDLNVGGVATPVSEVRSRDPFGEG